MILHNINISVIYLSYMHISYLRPSSIYNIKYENVYDCGNRILNYGNNIILL